MKISEIKTAESNGKKYDYFERVYDGDAEFNKLFTSKKRREVDSSVKDDAKYTLITMRQERVDSLKNKKVVTKITNFEVWANEKQYKSSKKK